MEQTELRVETSATATVEQYGPAVRMIGVEAWRLDVMDLPAEVDSAREASAWNEWCDKMTVQDYVDYGWELDPGELLRTTARWTDRLGHCVGIAWYEPCHPVDGIWPVLCVMACCIGRAPVIERYRRVEDGPAYRVELVQGEGSDENRVQNKSA